MSNKLPYFYTDKPLFGLDIGHGTLKVMQLEQSKKPHISGYGLAKFDIKALDNGAIVDPKAIAIAIRNMFRNDLIGEITTSRVAMTIPAYRTFSRSIRLPKLSDSELQEAVRLEAEQYIPVPLQELYLDYSPIGDTADGGKEFFIVAVPKKVVDSYLELARMLGLEIVLIESTMAACSRFFHEDKNSGMASVIIDFGSLTADISIYDKTILATSTVAAGGLVFTDAIRKKLQISQEEAGFIKTKYGLDANVVVQKQVVAAVEPVLQKLMTEIRRIVRYYEERYGAKSHIDQVVMLGGGANMPGLSNFLTDALKVPVRTHNHPWSLFDYNEKHKLPAAADRLMFVTVAGLSLVNPKEVFAQ
ncbi:MAG TPA: type IV pilus assembly protein PilM [Candidatus Saccharimonadales bacterium]|nr:type IV pilus assembly protein PilM [Candidatus Saccharimonadales bacterium]